MKVRRKPKPTDTEVYDAVQWRPGLKLETIPPIVEEDRGFGLDGIITFGLHSELVAMDGMWILLKGDTVVGVIGDRWIKEEYEEVGTR